MCPSTHSVPDLEYNTGCTNDILYQTWSRRRAAQMTCCWHYCSAGVANYDSHSWDSNLHQHWLTSVDCGCEHANIGVHIRLLISVMTLDTLELRLKYHLATVAEYASTSDYLQLNVQWRIKCISASTESRHNFTCMNLLSEDIKWSLQIFLVVDLWKWYHLRAQNAFVSLIVKLNSLFETSKCIGCDAPLEPCISYDKQQGDF